MSTSSESSSSGNSGSPRRAGPTRSQIGGRKNRPATQGQLMATLAVLLVLVLAGVLYIWIPYWNPLTDLQRCAAGCVVAGLIGGVINAFLAYQGFVLPRFMRDSLANNPGVEVTVWLPGFLGNILVGGVAGLVYFALETPFQNLIAIGTRPADSADVASLTIGQLALAGLAGVAGAKFLTDSVEKRLLKLAVGAAAAAPANPGAAAAVGGSNALGILRNFLVRIYLGDDI